MTWYEPHVRVPRTCPLCGYPFWPQDSHDRRPLPEVTKATQALEGHDFRAHAGQLRRITLTWKAP
jgi:hypothetical protein